MHLLQSGSRSDKRKARGRGLPPSSGVDCHTKLGFACEALGLSSRAAVALGGFFGRRVLVLGL